MLAKSVGVEVHHYYSRNWLVRRVYRRRLQAALTLAAPTATHRALDLGCGAGFLAYNLAIGGVDTVAVDAFVELRAVKAILAPRLTPSTIRFVAGDAAQLPFQSRSFDVVFALDVLEHLADLPHGIAEIHRVLTPGGTLVVALPREDSPWYRIGQRFAREPNATPTAISTRQQAHAPHRHPPHTIAAQLGAHFRKDKNVAVPLFPTLYVVERYRR
jgi:ubiquinone/menaquinone biosynthesis C-methylase UbiE